METMIINQFVLLLTSIPFGLSVLLSYEIESETKKKQGHVLCARRRIFQV